jgi:hypothetical protein
MPFADWVLSSDNLTSDVNGQSVQFRTWEYLANGVTFLQANGWFTRGSSIDGSAGTLYSSTPDGVDRWAGLTRAQAQGNSNLIWHVLEHSVSGCQLVIAFSGAGGGLLGFFAWAKNKFEDSGAWRNAGSVTANVRPEDLTSSPASDREVDMDGSDTNFLLPQGGSQAGEYRFSYGTRVDGTGFYFLEFPDGSATPGTSQHGSLMAVFPLLDPATGDTNPFLAFGMRSGVYAHIGFGDTPSTNPGRVVGRTSGGRRKYCAYTFSAAAAGTGGSIFSDFNSPLKAADPFSGRYRALVMPFWCDTSPAHMRTTLGDFYAVSNSFAEKQTYLDLDGGRYFRYGDFLLPWGGSANGDHLFEPMTTRSGFAVTGGDSTAPVISNVSPTPGTKISRNSVISFDVTDNLDELARVLVALIYPSGLWEIAYDGTSFSPTFVNPSSVKTDIDDGMHVALLRNGGWPDPNVKIRVYALDQNGNEV